LVRSDLHFSAPIDLELIDKFFAVVEFNVVTRLAVYRNLAVIDEFTLVSNLNDVYGPASSNG